MFLSYHKPSSDFAPIQTLNVFHDQLNSGNWTVRKWSCRPQADLRHSLHFTIGSFPRNL